MSGASAGQKEALSAKAKDDLLLTSDEDASGWSPSDDGSVHQLESSEQGAVRSQAPSVKQAAASATETIDVTGDPNEGLSSGSENEYGSGVTRSTAVGDRNKRK